MTDNRDLDPFHYEEVYPEPAAIFQFQGRSVQELKDECLYVIDTNSLLVPYKIGSDSLTQIHETMKRLVDAKRLYIPAQVAREFASNRASHIQTIYDQLSHQKSNTTPPKKASYPLLDSHADYQKVNALAEEVASKVADYHKALNAVLQYIKDWNWNDPVSQMYGELFRADCIIELDTNKDETLADHKTRLLHKIPPGYKDAGKEDSGIGDLLIWKAILKLGSTQKKDVVFVTGEEKADWWHRGSGQPLYPRYELLDEYRRASNGKVFQMTKLSNLLHLFGSSERIVAEVENEERDIQIIEVRKPHRQRLIEREAIQDWLTTKFDHVIKDVVIGKTRYDFVASHFFGENIAVEFFHHGGPRNYSWVHRLLNNIKNSDSQINGLMAIFVFDAENYQRAIQEARNHFLKLENLGNLVIKAGYINEFGVFVEVPTLSNSFGEDWSD